jgi:large subunit ribosomal protein L2
MVRVSEPRLYKGRPHSALLEPKKRINGRNNTGRITVRHRGGGHKRHYRVVDFLRADKDGVFAKVERLEYDPNRSAHILLLCYRDGERRYVVAPEGVSVGDELVSGADAPVRKGNCLPLSNMPVGTTVHCVELRPGKGAQLARSAGSYAQLVAVEPSHALLRMKSGEVRKVPLGCRATVGTVGNSEHFLRKLGKAGAKVHRGWRPTVRGMAMNPVDHPMGGGEGRSKSNKIPRSPWGTPAKGFRTRKNERTSKMIVRRRRK